MTLMTTEPGFEDADKFYYRLVETSTSVPQTQRFDFSLRLILLLANQIGSTAVLSECITEAARPFTRSSTDE